MASRATQSAAIDAAWLTIAANLPAWIAAGGQAQLFVRWVNSQIAAADPALGREVQARLGSSQLSGFAATLTASDVTP
jgi:hypothetical protein